MGSRITAELRRLVEERAEGVCEYCLLHLADAFVGCQVDHVISEKHGGPTTPENLALACATCNRQKGSDVGSISTVSGTFVRLYHPRMDRWSEHFRLVGARIEWRTEVGEATVRLLRLNDLARIQERELLRDNGKYPRPAASRLMRPQ